MIKRIFSILMILTISLCFVSCKEEKKEMNYPFKILSSDAKVNATITMENGDIIELELYPDIAPVSVSNFVYLAESGFYNGLIFHRVISGFMIQGGDPDGIGTGGPGYSIEGEFSANGVKNDISHERGVISMARSKNFNSAGSQFFIMHNDADYLDGQYAAFGRVTEGIEVVDAIASLPTDPSDRPIEDVVIKSITIER